jgi:hypothetical protein
MKALAYISLVTDMAGHIDATRHTAASALFNAAKIADPNSELNIGSAPPIFNPLMAKSLAQFEEHISIQTYTQIVDQLNYYIGNVLLECFVRRPEMLKKSRTITWERVLSYSSMSDLHYALAEEYVQSLMFMASSQLFETLEKVHGFTPFERRESALKFFVDINLKRNLLVHNYGRVNTIFLSRISSPEKYNIGEKISVSLKELFMFVPLANSFVVTLDKYLCEKFDLPEKRIPKRKIDLKWFQSPLYSRKKRSKGKGK